MSVPDIAQRRPMSVSDIACNACAARQRGVGTLRNSAGKLYWHHSRGQYRTEHVAPKGRQRSEPECSGIDPPAPAECL
eukprot:3648925-Rhodomonas_salina.1